MPNANIVEPKCNCKQPAGCGGQSVDSAAYYKTRAETAKLMAEAWVARYQALSEVIVAVTKLVVVITGLVAGVHQLLQAWL